MKEIYDRYKFLILAILIAVLLWVYVNDQTDSFLGFINNDKDSFLLPLKIENLPEKYILENLSNTQVIVRLDGISLFQKYRQSDFKAYIDLKEVKEGENIRLVQVDTPSDVKIKGVDPNFVTVIVYEISE